MTDETSNTLSGRSAGSTGGMVSAAPGATCRLVHRGRWMMLSVSDGIEAITGHPASDFFEERIRSYESVIHPEDRAAVGAAVSNTLGSREPYALEYRICHSDGSTRWVQAHGQGTLSRRTAARWAITSAHVLRSQIK